MIIGLLGQAGSGKDAVGKILRERHGYATLAFADPLKCVVQDAWGLLKDVLWGPSELRELPIARCVVCGATGIMRGDCKCGEPYPWLPIRVEGEMGPGMIHGDSQPLTPRLALQTLGTEWGRALDPDVWARMGVRRACELAEHGPKANTAFPGSRIPVDAGHPYKIKGVAITDCRFPNEARLIREAGGSVWRIDRPGPDRPAEPWRSHASEVEQECIVGDHLIVNTGTLDNLAGKVEHVLAATLDACESD